MHLENNLQNGQYDVDLKMRQVLAQRSVDDFALMYIIVTKNLKRELKETNIRSFVCAIESQWNLYSDQLAIDQD